MNNDLKVRIGDEKCNLIQITKNKELYFYMKKENSLPVTINNAKVQTCSTQTHQGLLLDQKLNLNEQIQKKLQDITR